jgi:replication initiation protein RepC
MGNGSRDNIMEHINTSYEPPKGGRVSSPKFRGLAQVSEDFDGLPNGVSHWDLMHLVKDVGPHVGFTPKMIALLEYYVRFTREGDWQAGGRPIVYQSQAKTAMYFRVSERQIQRLETMLFERGTLTWDTAANNKRFGVRSESGELLYASGVDLAPLAALREELEKKKEEIRLADAAWFETKRQISWYRGRIRSLIAEAADHAGLERAAAEAQHAYNGIDEHIRTYMDLAHLRELLKAHVDVYTTLSQAIENHMPASADCGYNSEVTSNMSPTDDQNVVHIYSTNKNQFSKENTSSPSDGKASEGSVAASSGTEPQHRAGGEAYKEEWIAALAAEKSRISWKQVLAACSERFKDRFPMTGRPLGWPDITNAAYDLLPTLGISKSAWVEACMILGRDGAALAVMIIDRKMQDTANTIKNPGGYLRAMTTRAKEGKLNLHGSVFGLLKRDGEKYDA